MSMAQAAGSHQGPAPLTALLIHQAFPKGGKQGPTALGVPIS